MALGAGPKRGWSGSQKTALLVLAALGAWIGHFAEYVRVAGWHAGIADMTSASHAYFMPAGVVVVLLVLGSLWSFRRGWATLDQRWRSADAQLRRPSHRVGSERRPDRAAGRTLGISRAWLALSILQTGIWVAQENVEVVSRGGHAPLLGVLTGSHLLAPVIQVELALILAVGFSVAEYVLQRRRRTISALETLVAHRSRRLRPRTLAPMPAPAWTATPVQRWGVKLFGRPPPPSLVTC